jgi:hypothetical protein
LYQNIKKIASFVLTPLLGEEAALFIEYWQL